MATHYDHETEVIDVTGELCKWLPDSFRVRKVGGAVEEIRGIKWTDGRMMLLRERESDLPFDPPYGTVTHLYSYGWSRPYHKTPEVRRMVPKTSTEEIISGVAGEREYQVRFRDIIEVTAFTIDGVAKTLPEIFTTRDWFTPDAIRIALADLPAVTNGSVLKVTYTYRTYDEGTYLEGYECYRLEMKTITRDEDLGLSTEFPHSRLAEMWLSHMIQFMHVNMQQPIGNSGVLRLVSAGDDLSGAGLLPVVEETESRAVLDIHIYRRARVFTAFELRRIGRYGYRVNVQP